MPIAIETDKAKAQHYELPTTFFKLVLRRNLKYREGSRRLKLHGVTTALAEKRKERHKKEVREVFFRRCIGLGT